MNKMPPFVVNHDIQLNARLRALMFAVEQEELQYAADELVELAEEILHQIAAVGFVYYLTSKNQKEVYNDFLIQLFNSSGHDYNAGPLFRWAANMVQELKNEMPEDHYKFFWIDGELNTEVNHLAHLRNEVMHGFFVLPPERNILESEKLSSLLQGIVDTGLIEKKGNYHFSDHTGFTGNWNITEQAQWNALLSDSPFGDLCERIIHENTEGFWKLEEDLFQSANEEVPTEIKQFVQNHIRGGLAVWTHPNDFHSSDLYAAVGSWLRQQDDIIVVGYQLHHQGLSYTGNFLLNRLFQLLNSDENVVPKNKKLEVLVAKLRSELSGKKIVVLINRIHIALFSPQHVTNLNNFLYQNNILFVAIGHHYEHFNGFFNSSIEMVKEFKAPSRAEAVEALHNYLRFKGPSKERIDEKGDVKILEDILHQVLAELNQGSSLYARRFADNHGYDIEYVHEIFALLHPWVSTVRESFQADELDHTYGFPAKMTEVTPIYLSLGRRDLKLEYQHKVISI